MAAAMRLFQGLLVLAVLQAEAISDSVSVSKELGTGRNHVKSQSLLTTVSRVASVSKNTQHQAEPHEPSAKHSFLTERSRAEHSHLQPDVSGLVEEESFQSPTMGISVSHQSWFSRLGNAFWSVVAGLVLIPFSIAFLWGNEKRNARQESLMTIGKSEVHTIEAKSADNENNGTFVHLSSADAKGLDAVSDKRFPSVKLDSGCLRLRSQVQVFQWEETKKEEKKKDSVGGGETTVTTYTYSKKWSDNEINSYQFHQASGHPNTVKVQGLPMGKQEATNDTVKYGDSHYLTQELVGQLSNFQNANGLVNGSLAFSFSFKFELNDGWFHYPPQKGSPQIGDVRVQFEYVLDGPATVLALQTDDKQHAGSATFLPYRMVARGICCGVGEEVLQKRLIAEGKKDSQELYEQDKCDSGPFACLCCCCNLVAMCFANLAPPQIYAAFPGHLSAKDAFDQVTMLGMVMKWGFRLLGWLLLYVGTYALFEPFLVILDIFPFLGPYISDGVSWVLGVLVFLVTAAIAASVISMAYMIYHPLVGFLYLALTAGIVAGIMALSNMLQHTS